VEVLAAVLALPVVRAQHLVGHQPLPHLASAPAPVLTSLLALLGRVRLAAQQAPAQFLPGQQERHMDMERLMEPQQELQRGRHQERHSEPQQELHWGRHQERLHQEQRQQESPQEWRRQEPPQEPHQEPHQERPQERHQERLHQERLQERPQEPHQELVAVLVLVPRQVGL